MVANGQSVTLGVRPENVSVGGDAGIDAEVEATEKIGDSIILHLTYETHEFTAKTPATVRIDRGDTVTLRFEERIHLFDDEGDILTASEETGPWVPKQRSDTRATH
jgi:ABC-type sugar transport system ATPase subunit